jgi:hypothetical protein
VDAEPLAIVAAAEEVMLENRDGIGKGLLGEGAGGGFVPSLRVFDDGSEAAGGGMTVEFEDLADGGVEAVGCARGAWGDVDTAGVVLEEEEVGVGVGEGDGTAEDDRDVGGGLFRA